MSCITSKDTFVPKIIAIVMANNLGAGIIPIIMAHNKAFVTSYGISHALLIVSIIPSEAVCDVVSGVLCLFFFISASFIYIYYLMTVVFAL